MSTVEEFIAQGQAHEAAFLAKLDSYGADVVLLLATTVIQGSSVTFTHEQVRAITQWVTDLQKELAVQKQVASLLANMVAELS